MKSIIGLIFSLALVSPTNAQERVSCEAWVEASGQSTKLISEIKGWIVREVRRQAGDIVAAKSFPSVECANLACLKDVELLAAVNDWCRKYPGVPLSNAVSDSAFILAAEQDQLAK